MLRGALLWLFVSDGMLTGAEFCRTEVGVQAEEIVARGGFLPDEVMLKILTSKLDTLQNKVRSSFIWY